MADNLYAQFQRSINAPTPRWLAEVVTPHDNGATLVSLLPGGAHIKVKSAGDNAIGDRVIVQDGAIVEDGPVGTVINVNV